ncbi:H/K ATPase alpha subunit [Purpureocillium lavendulum]|uniref:H/K ATPase alpha subunit n=1 Tax=Purpureocillium lavendulum TaxID=1247861 RepID=A0AB34FKY3_9HYPO|nr:H/K ATPase alpha subunit [Purpureocillium lavendulum]
MSQKVTSKNLSYNSSLPPFLAALRAQAGGAPGPDPILAGQRRSAKKRSSSEEAEDAPLVVDEHGNAVSVEVDREGVVKEPPAAAAREDSTSKDKEPAADRTERPDAEAKVAFGGRKRKVGKVVGDAKADDEEGGASKDAPRQPDSKDSKASEKPAEKKVKKKAKKIKLSFDEDEG